jgi:hypothetical protein
MIFTTSLSGSAASGGNLLEKLFSDSALRADPVFRQVFEGCPRRDPVFRVADGRIIDIAASRAFPFFHLNPPSLEKMLRSIFL